MPDGALLVEHRPVAMARRSAFLPQHVAMPSNYDASAGADHVSAFIDDDWSAVMVKVVSGTDPVELLPRAARSLAAALVRLADELDRHDAGEP